MNVVYICFIVLVSLTISRPAKSDVSKLMQMYNEIKAGEAAQAEIDKLNKRIRVLEAEIARLKNKNNADEVKRLQQKLIKLKADGKRYGKDGFSSDELDKIKKSEDGIRKGVAALKKELPEAPVGGASSPSEEGAVSDPALAAEPVAIAEPDLDAPKAGGAPPPPPPPPPQGSGIAIAESVPGFTAKMLEDYKNYTQSQSKSYKDKPGQDGAFPPGLWPSVEVMELTEGNQNLQVFGTKTPTLMTPKKREEGLKKFANAKVNFQASVDLIKKYQDLVKKGKDGFKDQQNHVTLRYMVDLMNVYKSTNKDIRQIEWPKEALTDKSYKKLLDKVQVAFNRLKSTLQKAMDTEDKIEEIKAKEQKAREKAQATSKLLSDWSKANAVHMQQNTNKIVSSPIVREAIFAWYMEDAKKAIEDAKKTPEDLEKAAEASKKQKVFSSVPEQIFGRFANVYIKPFIDTSYDDDYQGILKEFSQQLMVELTAIGIPKADPSRKDNALFVADIEAYLNSGDKTKTKTLSLALWRAARKILMEKGDERLKSDAPIKPIELNKFEPVTYELLVYSLQKDIHKSVKEDLDNLIDQMIDEPNQSAKELEQKIQHSLKSALRQAMTSAGVKNHINVLQSKSNISFEFLLKRDEKGYQNPKNAVLKKAREAFNKSAQELHNKHRLFINQGDNPENPLLYPPSIDNLEPFFTGTLPVDDALMDQLVSKIWDALLAYYRAKYNLFEDIPHADKEERELVLTAVKDHNMNLSQVFSGTSSPVLHQYLGDEPDFNKTPVLGYMKRILALWVLSKKPKPAQP